jgi:hypothetical protein
MVIALSIDGDADDLVIRALDVVRRWNGWAVPRVTAAEVDRIADHYELRRDAEGRVLWTMDDDEPCYATRQPDGTYVLDTGWCWDEVCYTGPTCAHCSEASADTAVSSLCCY